MPEQRLNDSEIGPVFKKVRGESMPKRVQCHALLDSSLLGLTRFGGRFRYAAFFTECISSNSIGLL